MINNYCSQIHAIFRGLPRHRFPFDENLIPQNGIYILFEKGEHAHEGERIVRVGTHTGENQLRPRLRQHFIQENKDRSIFRKNIGRAILNKEKDPFLKYWEIDLTPKANRQKYSHRISKKKLAQVEKAVMRHMRTNLTFAAFEVSYKKNRLELESNIISTVSLCDECKPSSGWLGHHSPKRKIRDSGLWLVNELYKEPLKSADIKILKGMLSHDKASKYVESVRDLKDSVKNFMETPELWKDAIGTHPRYFVHANIGEEHCFGLSKFCMFKEIDLFEYISNKRYEIDGGTARKHINKITGQNWISINGVNSKIRNEFENWFFRFCPPGYNLDKISFISLES